MPHYLSHKKTLVLLKVTFKFTEVLKELKAKDCKIPMSFVDNLTNEIHG